jgi:Glyoxalase/Bleomycin resistance protein/Dioxygenase superfamily
MNFAALRPFANLVQHGYVTTDLDRALQRFAEYGASEFARSGEIDSHMIGDRRAIMSVAMGCMGPLMIEVIHPISGQCEVFRDALPAEGFAVRLHHVGYRVDDAATFEALRQAYPARGCPLVMDGQNSRTGTRYFYADTRAELGHYVEYICPSEQGAREYAALPQNDR